MAAFLPSDADRLRIAIALTALKFKPANQSCASYVLHLQSIFPASTPTAPTSDGSWKTHALALEKELAGLKEKYEAEQISASSSYSSRVRQINGGEETLVNPTAPTSDAAPSSSQLVKRKPKKKTTDKRPDGSPHVDLETLLQDLSSRPEFVSIPSSDSLFSSFVAFQQLTSAMGSSEVAITAAQRSLLLSTTIRAFTALASVLRPILRSPAPNVASHASTLQNLAVFVNEVVSSSLPFLLRKPKRGTDQPASVSSLLNQLLDALMSIVFVPIVESFSPLSHWYLASLFPTTPSTSLPVDLRPGLLHFFQSAFSPLVSAPSAYEVNLRATIALTALRELESLFPPRRTDDTRLPWTHVNRVNGLVRKDALWYLCTVLHVLFTPPKDSSKSTSTASVVCGREIANAFTRIANRCRRCRLGSVTSTTGTCNTPDRDSDVADEGLRFAGEPNALDFDVIDEVGFEMLLGIMERYWEGVGEV